MKITQNTAVQMHYNLSIDGGVTVDSTQGRAPLAYLHGHGHIVTGVEQALEGKVAGDKVDVIVPPEDGYGARDPQLDIVLPLSAFPEASRSGLTEGTQFRGPHPVDPNQVAAYLIIKIENDQVMCTANHPLAGETLHFKIEVVEVRQGTQGEIADGLIHSSDCSTGCC